MPDENPTTGRRRPRALVPVLLASLAVAVALPVSAALAGGGDGDAQGGGGTSAPALESVQQSQENERPRGEDCPDRERGGDEDAAATESPEV